LERNTPHDGREFTNRRERKQRLRSLPKNSDLEGLELNKKCFMSGLKTLITCGQLKYLSHVKEALKFRRI
jgi:hypothetical protein